MNVVDISLVCSAGAAGALSAIITTKLNQKKSIPAALSIARYAAWVSLGGFVIATLIQKLA